MTDFSSGDRVYIKRRTHPHSGEYGRLGAYNPSVGMWEIALEDCPHWTRGCFAVQSDFVRSKEPAPAHRRSGS